jgi:hypothetical protein
MLKILLLIQLVVNTMLFIFCIEMLSYNLTLIRHLNNLDTLQDIDKKYNLSQKEYFEKKNKIFKENRCDENEFFKNTLILKHILNR